ncbi:MAG: hypothetical protein J0H49_18500 [Acidobacteria bacterium]|nr:hypothetical protein [Acidobacteriota bacterium]
MSKADVKKFKGTSGCDRTYVQGGDATGDVIHVFAAMKAEPTAALVIFQWDTNTGEAIRQKMLTLGIDAKRMLVQIEAGPRNTVRNRVTGWCKDAGFTIIQLHESTERGIGALQDDALRKSMHVTLRGDKGITATDTRFIDFWQAKFKASTVGNHTVVLWGRSSGKDKTTAQQFGPHPYGDSSTTGLIQIATKCLEKSWKVVLCGDIDATKQNRFPPACVFIGKFWRPEHWAGNALTQKEQVRLFYILKQVLKAENFRMVHVGMRSGNLDYFAFAGQTIVYLVANGFDDRRIKALADAVPKRWVRSEPAKTPRQAYQRTWDPEWLNVVGRTDLGLLMNNAQEQRQMFKALNYPIDPQTQINGNLLYRAIKAKLKVDPNYGDGTELLNAYLTQKSKRGFTDDYLNDLIGLIAGKLV